MVKHHSRTGKTHYLSNLLAHLRLVAMYLTVRAEGLILHERAMLASASGIAFKLRAFRAELLFCAVLFAAVQLNHEGNHFFFLLTLCCNIFIFCHYQIPFRTVTKINLFQSAHSSVLHRIHFICYSHCRFTMRDKHNSLVLSAIIKCLQNNRLVKTVKIACRLI